MSEIQIPDSWKVSFRETDHGIAVRFSAPNGEWVDTYLNAITELKTVKNTVELFQRFNRA